MPRPLLILALLFAACAAAQTAAQELPASDWKGTAATLQQSIVTVRIRRAETPKTEDAKTESPEVANPALKHTAPPQASVTVCTGFCVAPDKVVTTTLAASDDRIRLTLAGGAQCDARL